MLSVLVAAMLTAPAQGCPTCPASRPALLAPRPVGYTESHTITERHSVAPVAHARPVRRVLYAVTHPFRRR